MEADGARKVALVALAVLLVGCSPKYPKCRSEGWARDRKVLFIWE